MAIYVFGITSNNTHLMPWRTVVEIAKRYQEADIKVHLISNGQKIKQDELCGVPITYMPKLIDKNAINLFAEYCKQNSIVTLYYPLAFRHSLNNLQRLTKTVKIQYVWYWPGAWYSIKDVVKSIPSIGLKASVPYLYQSLVPKRRFVKQLARLGDHKIITMTEYTRAKLEYSGYKREHILAVPPGKAPITHDEAVTCTSFSKISRNLKGRPYYLFFGPPQALRGIRQILAAFDMVSKHDTEVCLVCLFRPDDNICFDKIKAMIGRQRHVDRIYCLWESVSGDDLSQFIEQCRCVVKPFLLVPSEIPLAVIESAGYGKPVICTGPGGTGRFVEKYGLMVPSANSAALADAMREMCSNEKKYYKKCQQAKIVYEAHPNWNEVATRWLGLLEHNAIEAAK